MSERFRATWRSLDPEEGELAAPLLRHLAELVEHLAQTLRRHPFPAM